MPVASALAIALCAADAKAQLQPLEMRCHNPSVVVPVRLTRNENGRVSAYSDLVQFNVAIETGPGTIFVDGRNDGVCTLTLPPRYSARQAYASLERYHPRTRGGGVILQP